MASVVTSQRDLKIIKMAKKFNRSIADAFTTALDETEEWKVEFNLRELVEESFFSIEKARERKASWEQIAEILQKTIGGEAEIKSDTLRQYYFDALKIKDELAKTKRKKASKRKGKTVTTSAKSSGTLPKTSSEKRETIEIKTNAETEDTASKLSHIMRQNEPAKDGDDAHESREKPSSFNLRPS